MLVIGLTGGIGSGKSTVADRLAEQGVPILDADVIARELVEPGSPALSQITAEFGPQVLDKAGRLDRKKLRDRVFHDPQARRRLEAILHPLIVEAMTNRLSALESAYAVLVIPLLFEANLTHLVDRILVVDIPPQQQVTRVAHRDNMSEDEIRAIIEAQYPRTKRLHRADDVIDNSRGMADLLEQTDRLHRLYVDMSGN